MGTKIHCKRYLPLYYSMRYPNEDSSSSSWPLFYADKAVMNGQYYNGFMPRLIMDGYPGYDKDALKQKILEHEAVFKNQVYELHRLYGIQRDMMDEVRRKEPSCGIQDQESAEPSSSLSRRGSHLLSQDAQNWHMAGFPLANSGFGRTSATGIDIGNSPMIGKNESGAQHDLFQFLNGSVSKKSDALESRPFKVRKKLFDLQLPSAEYVDTEDKEKSPEVKVADIPTHAMNGSLRGGLDCLNKLQAEDRIGLDLNEPVEIEEAIAPSSVDFLGQCSGGGDSEVTKLPVRSNAGHLGRNGETVHLQNGLIFNSVRSKESEAGSSKTVPCPSGHPSRMYLNGYSGLDLSRCGNRYCLESCDRSCDRSSYSHSGMLLARQASGSYPYHNSCLIPPWMKPKSSLPLGTHALEPVLNSSVSMDQAFLSSCQSQEPFRGNQQAHLLSGSVGEQPVNGFYQRCRLDSKDKKIHLPASGFDRFQYRKSSTVMPPCSIHSGFLNMPNGLCRADSNQVLDINLNDAVSEGSSDEAVIVQADEKMQPVDHKSAIPWLTRKPSHPGEAANSRKLEVSGNKSYRHDSSTEVRCERKIDRDLNQPLVPEILSISSDCRIAREGKGVEASNVKRLLGVPISETGDLKETSRVSTSTGDDCRPQVIDAFKHRKNGMIDINLENEPDDDLYEEPIIEKEQHAKPASIREHIDLNCCASDAEEDTLTPFVDAKNVCVNVPLEIDLEPSILPVDNDASFQEDAVEVALHSLQNKESESLQDETLSNAAEVLIAISSFHPKIHKDEHVINDPDASLAETFLSFVDAVTSRFTVEVDEFEAATLQLLEMKDKDCMPMPFILDETGLSAISAASRRVQSRRGRQRRDFQRDILPGIVSLSRHELTEDLQIFSGLMRATGHHWNSGLTRRNGARSGSSHGRRRAVIEPVSAVAQTTAGSFPPVSKIKACLVERSLMGWGKTMRRPRPQRCHTAAASAAAAAAVLT